MGINTQLVTVTIDEIVLGVPAGSPTAIECVISLGDYNQTRNTTKYSCMSNNDSSVGLGSIERDPLTFEVMYGEIAADGQEKLKAAFDSNASVIADIEFNNNGGVNGTTLTGEMGVSAYNMTFPKDGQIGATFTMEFMAAPVLKPAA